MFFSSQRIASLFSDISQYIQKYAKPLDPSILTTQIDQLHKRLGNDQFWTYNQLNKIQKSHQELINSHSKSSKNPIRKLFIKRQIKQFSLHLIRELTIKKQQISSLQNDYIKNQEQIAKDIFCDENNSPLLSKEQIRAVIAEDDRNLVLAGAGSGKTRVITYKIRYLMQTKDIRPEEILVLTFSNKAANDLKKKLLDDSKLNLNISTIHSFCSRYLKSNKHTFKLLDDKEKEFESNLISAITDTIRDSKSIHQFLMFHSQHFYNVKPYIFYKNIAELRKDLKLSGKYLSADENFFHPKYLKRDFLTLKQEMVRSIDERYIADFLFLNQIRYVYERQYPHIKSKYQPDFYLPDYDIYIEHLALDKNGKPPPWFDTNYLQELEWKRETHKRFNTRLVELTSYQLNQKDSENYLAEIFQQVGVQLSPTYNDNTLATLTAKYLKLFIQYYQRWKMSGQNFSAILANNKSSPYLFFLKLMGKVFTNLENSLKQKNLKDFSDLLIDASNLAQQQETSTYKYIFVDEFQDTSTLALRLIHSLISEKNAVKIYFVGDDWQSIYGFNGSDITIISDYSKNHTDCLGLYLEDNYRSTSPIVKLGQDFISKNPVQIKKNVRSMIKDSIDTSIQFIYKDQLMDYLMQIPKHEKVFLLGRYNADNPDALIQDLYDQDYVNIEFLTIHASKGLEAKHVFILFPNEKPYEFPSLIQDHPVLDTLLCNKENFPFAEERRLMYVAITRAENHLYFVSPFSGNKEPSSIFWSELKELVSRIDFSLN